MKQKILETHGVSRTFFGDPLGEILYGILYT